MNQGGIAQSNIVGPPSIAVLPFENVSADPEQAYFADGITEEIITALGSLRSLRVVARTSTFALKGQAGDLPRSCALP